MSWEIVGHTCTKKVFISCVSEIPMSLGILYFHLLSLATLGPSISLFIKLTATWPSLPL